MKTTPSRFTATPLRRCCRTLASALVCVLLLCVTLPPAAAQQPAATPPADAAPVFTPAPPYGQGEDAYLTRTGIARHDDTLYFTWNVIPGKQDRLLVAADISNPAQPREIGRLALEGFPQDVAIRGSRAYVVNGLSLYTIDITSPAEMKVLHKLDITTSPVQGPQAIDIDTHGVAWLACRRAGILAVDLSQPDQPRIVAAQKLRAFARDILVTPQGRIFVAADTQGLYIINQQQNFTSKASVFDRSAIQPYEIADIKGTPASLTSHDGQVYFTAGSLPLASISATWNPHASLDTREDNYPWTNVLADRGTRQVYFGYYCHDLAIVQITASSPRTYGLIAAGEGGLLVADLTEQSKPVMLPSQTPVAGSSSASLLLHAVIALQGKPYAYAVDMNHGLRVFDITSPAQPRLLPDSLLLSQ